MTFADDRRRSRHRRRSSSSKSGTRRTQDRCGPEVPDRALRKFVDEPAFQLFQADFDVAGSRPRSSASSIVPVDGTASAAASVPSSSESRREARRGQQVTARAPSIDLGGRVAHRSAIVCTGHTDLVVAG